MCANFLGQPVYCACTVYILCCDNIIFFPRSLLSSLPLDSLSEYNKLALQQVQCVSQGWTRLLPQLLVHFDETMQRLLLVDIITKRRR